MAFSPQSNRNAWVQLYEARRVTAEPETRPAGRPPGVVPRRKVGLTLSQGENSEIDIWQERFSTLLRRKVSAGETVGILTRMASARFTRLGLDIEDITLGQLVEKLVGMD